MNERPAVATGSGSGHRAGLAELALVLALACALACTTAAESVGPGMSAEEVVRRLGPPDRRAALVGKLLVDLDDVGTGEPADRRIVYVYERRGLQVWFADGEVTAVVQSADEENRTRESPYGRERD